MKKALISRTLGFSSALATALMLAGNVLAQTTTGTTTTTTTKGGTSAALPAAGTTELTYILFIGGIILFVAGAIKLALSFKD